MKTFMIRSEQTGSSILELVDELENGFLVRIVRKRDDWEEESQEFITRDLFETCIRTGYIAENIA